MATEGGTMRYALRCNVGPAKGLWWTGGGWGSRADRAHYPSPAEAREAAERDLDPDAVADVVAVRAG